jgi:steroid delta-isomerase-like uncharacterized protein
MEDTAMSGPENQERFRQFLEEVVNQKNIDAFDDHIAENFIEHEDTAPLPQNRDGVRQMFASILESFPDLKVTIDDMVSDDDKVWARCTWQGTHQGEFQGIAATNRPVSFSVIDIVRFSDGKAVEHWGVGDTFSLMTQLGAIAPE